MAIKSALLLALASSASGLMIISPEKLTHNQAVMFCASQKSRLLDVTTQNRDQVIAGLGGKDAWIASWDFNFYTGQCVHTLNSHIGGVDCDLLKHAACNEVIHLKSTRNVQDAQEGHVVEEAVEGEAEKAGARPSHRHQKPCEKPCDRSAANPCAVERGYEYVYLTQTVDKVYTSVSTTTVFTSTSVIPIYSATVAAYVVSGSNNQVEGAEWSEGY